MKRLHLFLLKSFIGPFVMTFFIALFILLMQFLWKYIDDLVGKGLEINQISELLFYASARFVPAALPIAMLLSSVMVFGKLGEQYELVALKSAGISFYKLLFPLFIFVLSISYGSYLFSNYVMPIANLKNGAMIYDIQKKKPALNIKEGIFYKDIEGYSIKINEKDPDGITLNDIIIYDHTTASGNNKVLIAESGKMKMTADEKFLELILFNGHSYIDINNKEKKKKPFRTTNFKENLIRFNIESFFQMKNSEKLYKGHYAMMNNYQLKNAIDSLETEYLKREQKFEKKILKNHNNFVENTDYVNFNFQSVPKNKKNYEIANNNLRKLKSLATSRKNDLEYRKIIITKHQIEWHRKISLAFACIILFFIGAPLGAIIRKGGFGIPVLFSVFFFILYHILSMIGEKAAKDLSIKAIEGMWLANLVFIPIAIILIYKAKDDSKILNFSKINRVINYLKIKIKS